MILKNGKVYRKGNLRNGSILINRGKIEAILESTPNLSLTSLRNNNEDGKEMDCKGKIILPGIIDIHSHLRDMGQQKKETFETGTKAAILSGITTVFTMPNTKPPAINSKIVKQWMDAAKGRIYTDVAFIGGVPLEIDEDEIKSMKKLGILGLKIYPHAPLNGIDWTLVKNIQKLLKISSQLKIPIFIHPAWPQKARTVDQIREKFKNSSLTSLEVHDILNPISGELRFINHIIKNYYKFIKTNDVRPDDYPIIHMCHVSSKEGYRALKRANSFAMGLKITFEITPHHMLLSNKLSLDKDSYGKVLPPLRTPKHSHFLYEEYRKGNVFLMGTDHAPHSLKEKSEEFFKAPSGFPGFETYPLLMLERVYTDAVSMSSHVRCVSENPAHVFNLTNKGSITEGFTADLMIIKKTSPYPIKSKNFHTKAKFTPFENYTTSVRIENTFLNGHEINGEQYNHEGKIINPFE